MNILLLNQFLVPDPALRGSFWPTWRRQAEQGHEVTVVCSRGGYAGGADGGEAASERVRVVRIASLPFVRGRVGRMAPCRG